MIRSLAGVAYTRSTALFDAVVWDTESLAIWSDRGFVRHDAMGFHIRIAGHGLSMPDGMLNGPPNEPEVQVFGGSSAPLHVESICGATWDDSRMLISAEIRTWWDPDDVDMSGWRFIWNPFLINVTLPVERDALRQLSELRAALPLLEVES